MSEPALEPEILVALEATGLRPLAWACLSNLRSPIIDRTAYRIETQDKTLKARRLESEAAAVNLTEVRRELPEAFAPVLARHGRVLLEEWIAGEVLGAAPPRRYLEEAGALLGELHARRSLGPKVLHALCATAGHRSIAVRALRHLRATGHLPGGQAVALARAMRRLDPGRGRHGLIHFDFCGENMVVDEAGHLHVVDNERVTVDALGFDLARAWYRWNLAARDWECFRQAYAERLTFREEEKSFDFWRLVAVARAAALRTRVAPEKASVPIACLRALAEELAS